ncbi:hypothetical protein BD779DRAFT_952951 [Infundibulicybe gibba]|nr:hypothetical protein BD779DRAFT_952951 [Infundibulicybe gibba]
MSTGKVSPPLPSPLQRLALHSTTTCASHASVYGKCILATYTDVKKDSCKEEYAKFGQCIRTAVCFYLAQAVPTVIQSLR